MVLWCIALLTGVTLLLVGIIEGWTEEEGRAGKLFRARQQALSGVAIAMNPGIHPGDPLLSRTNSGTGEGYHVEIKDESGLINPNHFLSQNRRDVLGRLFTTWGLDKNSSDAAADGLFDWQSQSPFKSLHGAKKEDYEAIGRSGFPPNAPFASPEEMELVIGFDPVVQGKPDWRSFFSTYTSGAVNLLRAPRGVLTDLFGLNASQADAWISLRNGKDGIEGTEDDPVFPTVDDALRAMGANGLQKSLMEAAGSVGGSVRRIESAGTCNGVNHTIIVIGDPQSGGTLLGWSEE
jgi:hypothetical protein